MSEPRVNPALPLAGKMLLCLLMTGAFAVAVHAQEARPSTAGGSENRAQGIQLFRQGDLKGAIQRLQAAVKERKEDADAWFYLGLSLSANNDIRNARKAYETAVKLRPDLVPAQVGLAYMLLLGNKLSEALRAAERTLTLDERSAEARYIIGSVQLKKGYYARALDEAEAALKINSTLAAAFILKSQALLALYMEETSPPGIREKLTDKDRFRYRRANVRLEGAAESLEQYLKLKPKAADVAVWRGQLEVLRAFSRAGDNPGAEGGIFPSSSVDVKVRILKRPEPSYSGEARSAGIEGTVVLLAVFAADGKVKNILVLQSPGYGLTENAINAARQIRFEPAIKDGKPVSTVLRIEYNFGFY
jgi:TonB family protein